MCHESAHVHGGRVEPLHVVDCQNRRCLGRGGPNDLERAARHRHAIQGAFVRRSPQRELERAALRFGEGIEHSLVHAVEEVAQTQEREGALGLRSPTDEYAIGAATGSIHSRAPYRRLANSRVAFKNHRGGTDRDGVEEPVCPRDLPLPSD